MQISQEIYEGLIQAVSRGDSINNAVQTFENAGYTKNEINEAVRLLQMNTSPGQLQQANSVKIQQPQQIFQQNSISMQPKKIPMQSPKIIQKVSQYGNVPQQQIIKTPISNYSPSESKTNFLESNTIVIILSIMLFLLLGLLVALFFFKDAVISFFNNLFV